MRGDKSTEQISIDDLLERQKQAGSAATIEAVEGKPSLVKVTPWVAGAGCLCQFAIEVPKSAIEHVTPTGEKHHCCGKVLTVVEVKFKDKSGVTLAEVFGQLSARATAAAHGHDGSMERLIATPKGGLPSPGCLAGCAEKLLSCITYGHLNCETVWASCMANCPRVS